MTENLAGRGEGLAGPLTGQDVFEAVGYVNAGLSYWEVVAQRLNTRLAALEAAAPASTAPRSKDRQGNFVERSKVVAKQICQHLNVVYEHYGWLPDYLQNLMLAIDEEARAALATPSPQASRQEQWFAFFCLKCGAGINKPSLCSKCAVPAATQEQPTGSEAVERGPNLAIFREVLRLHSSWVHFPEDGHLECRCHETICKKFRIHHRETVDAWLDHVMPLLFPGGCSMSRRNREPVTSGDCIHVHLTKQVGPMDGGAESKRYACQCGENFTVEVQSIGVQFGSPRKVGEDAPEQPFFFAIETAGGDWHDGEYSVFGDRREAQDRADDLNEELPKAEWYRVVPLYRRPSSVPVGEQKQEEGV